VRTVHDRCPDVIQKQYIANTSGSKYKYCFGVIGSWAGAGGWRAGGDELASWRLNPSGKPEGSGWSCHKTKPEPNQSQQDQTRPTR
jgi:hypothetical protein